MPTTETPATLVTLTANAVKKVQAYLAEDPSLRGKVLRMFVQEGGCAGYEYGFGFDDKKPTDSVVAADGFEVAIDPTSLPMLQGSVVDYVESLEGEGFAVTNPNAHGGCSCGHSFGT